MMKKIEVLPPTIVDGVPIPRKVAYVEDVGGNGCGCLLAVIVALATLAAAIFLSGCKSYTVVAADREVIPVRQSNAIEGEVTRRTYVEAEEDATGWYVPDAVMLELLEAE